MAGKSNRSMAACGVRHGGAGIFIAGYINKFIQVTDETDLVIRLARFPASGTAALQPATQPCCNCMTPARASLAARSTPARNLRYSTRMHDIPALVEQLAERLLQRRQWLAVAESCTGGWLAKCLTDRAGSSGWFERGFVTYSNAAKQELLDVPATVLELHGAVSEPTVLAMARGVLAHSHADVAVAVSGIAGPGGAVPGKPVGTVCFGFAVAGGRERAQTVLFTGDRAAVRHQAVLHALQQLLLLLTHA